MSKINYSGKDSLPGSTKSKKLTSAKLTSEKKKYNDGTYEGEFKDGKRNGHGKMIYNPGAFKWVDIYYYDGEWKDDMKNGKGEMTYDQDRKCKGIVYFENDKFTKGKNITYENGDIYNGELRHDDGAKSGKGTMQYANNDVFEGQWNFDRDNGTLKYANGDVFEGKFYDDNKTKQGKMTYKNGDIYDGELVNDKRHGKGKLIESGKVVYDGKWINDKKQTMSYKAKKRLSIVYQTVKNTIFGSKKSATKKKRDVIPFFKDYDITW